MDYISSALSMKTMKYLKLYQGVKNIPFEITQKYFITLLVSTGRTNILSLIKISGPRCQIIFLWVHLIWNNPDMTYLQTTFFTKKCTS